jgi:hypothetical protein
MGWFSKLLGPKPPEKPPVIHALPPVSAAEMAWRDGTTMPIPNWDTITPPAGVPESDEFWSGAARLWLEKLKGRLGGPYQLNASENFLMLTPHPEQHSKLVLEFAEIARQRILRLLDGIALDEGLGHCVILVFDTQDEYYEYISHYYKDDGEYSTSGGMFLDYGYGHFAFYEDQIDNIKPVIAHELAHCFVRHLPIPAWLNEGIAVNTETRIVRAPYSVHTPSEIREKHADFWDADKIQEFWSGKSWSRPDEGNMLSYDLAQKMAGLLASDFTKFTQFVNAAKMEDAGSAAALEILGFPVENAVEAILGEGNWLPQPERWHDGIERGQFRSG